MASKNLSDDMKEQIRKLLFSMHEDNEGKNILDHLMIDRFIQPRDDSYRWYFRAMPKQSESRLKER